MVGLAPRAGQVVHVLPTRAVSLAVRGTNAGKLNENGTSNGHVDGSSEKRGMEPLGKFILERCPSLRGTFTPSWWIRRSALIDFLSCRIGRGI